jgi:hypothetical protein
MTVVNTEFVARYGFEDQDTEWITNAFNLHGFLRIGEDYTSICTVDSQGLPGPFGIQYLDSPNESLCNLAKMCNYHPQFKKYYLMTIGLKNCRNP